MYLIYLIIIIILFIYNVTGMYYVILLLLAIINYIFASINLLNNYDDGPIRLIQLIYLATFIIIVLANINLLMIRILIL